MVIEYKCKFMEDCPAIILQRDDCNDCLYCPLYKEFERLEIDEEIQVKEILKYVSE